MSGARFVPRLKEMQAADTAGQDGPRWDVEGRDWPNREFSRFVTADGLRWHVQILGTGPVLLLVHGTGAASHSWGPLVPFVAPHFTVVTLDLPGHGFTALPAAEGLSLAGMARGVGRLMQVLGLQPEIAVGHPPEPPSCCAPRSTAIWHRSASSASTALFFPSAAVPPSSSRPWPSSSPARRSCRGSSPGTRQSTRPWSGG